ncbi:hypothetical protein LTR56_002412 [Elasticomyces elasticus]|nr:hypothetical protein LTR56_002412 [Elasticomyces elasticus]KAK3665976.1 hypothetical protein LTR22_003295 [Elasticomyces elasticus]KAK4929448.1 hypothetical protein LTR49_004052 [Elasticomyces elasticus]KAK5744255.1 hypothetical protein LTS12_023572 [Elasticomyces elasticus]
MPNLDTIAPELRLNIYEHVLRFDIPLKRTLFDRLLRKRSSMVSMVNTSILRVCRTIHEEALPVFYNSNAIWICHLDVCLSGKFARTSLSCAQNLIVHARMTADSEGCEDEWPYQTCDVEDTAQLLQQFAGPRYPRLQTLTIEAGLDDAGNVWYDTYGTIAEGLRKQGAEVTYTGLARFTIASTPTVGNQKPAITFQDARTAEAFDLLSGLTRPELENMELVGRLCWRIFGSYKFTAHAQLPLPKYQLNVLEDAHLSREDFDGQPISSAMYESMTRTFGEELVYS